MSARLVWITPDAEQTIAYCARVSNPANQENREHAKLLQYCIRNRHWSPFEMASACVEIVTTRDIARQILRHRSFSFQEFSQRYARVDTLPRAPNRPPRLQDKTNRQASVETDDQSLIAGWLGQQEEVLKAASAAYRWAIERGIAREVARAVLPEGLTPSRMYMAGTIRSWIHYIELRTGNGTQPEHVAVAQEIEQVLAPHLPTVLGAIRGHQ